MGTDFKSVPITYVRITMTPEMKESLAEVAGALERLNRALTSEMAEIERDGATPSKIQHLKIGRAHV